MSTLNEFQKRIYLATQAQAEGYGGVRKISKKFGVDKKTIHSGKRELKERFSPGEGRVRRRGGGRKPEIPRHPEWIEDIRIIIEPHTAGLPQNESVRWITIGVTAIVGQMKDRGHNISRYHVQKILDGLGFRQRSFLKNIPLGEVADRNAQFENIKEIRGKCEALGLPVISIDTKKKELIGNFKREGKVLCMGRPQAFDHDFKTFAQAEIVPHGIYDIATNTGYLTIGTSKDTSEFVCDNIERVWNDHLMHTYPHADTIVLLCDGGGSNSCRHHIVKQDLIKLARRIGKNILVMHYPPYCSKFNPIEHRLFSQITRSWSGAPLLTVDEAAERARATTTSKGLVVHVDISNKTYSIKRKVDDDFHKQHGVNIVPHPVLPKWNYLVKRG